MQYLNVAGIPYQVNGRMVRGLDYYQRTAFEVTADVLGAQNAVLGGGRYNGLAKELGGPDIPGIGFAIGMERLLSMIDIADEEVRRMANLFIAHLGDAAKCRAFELANTLRKIGIRTELDYSGRSLKSQMRRADKLKCRYVLILGDRELAEGQVQWRDMSDGEQERLPLDGLAETVRNILSKRG